jgi:hypothetical protein
MRALGYDSVYDAKSGFLLSLDNTKVRVAKATKLPTPDAIISAQARYNADAETASHYPKLLTSDANLRDSAYKVLSQVSASTDAKLSEVQQRLIDGIKPQKSVLPEVSTPSRKPETFIDVMEELSDDVTNPCGI